jgi:hypothetical protein
MLNIPDYKVAYITAKQSLAASQCNNLFYIIANSGLQSKVINMTKKEIVFKNGSQIQFGVNLPKAITFNKILLCNYEFIEKIKGKEPTQELYHESLGSVNAGIGIIITMNKPDPLTEAWKLAIDTYYKRSDFGLLFFPWYLTDVLPIYIQRKIPEWLQKYFEKVEYISGVKLTESQKQFYTNKYESLGEETKKEYPSYIEEVLFE